MTPSTFLWATLITLAVFVILRLFWKAVLIVGFIVYVIVRLLFYSFVSTLLWIIFVTQSSQGWGWLFSYFFIFYSAIVGIYAIIAMDIFQMIVDGVRGFIKSLK